MHNICRPFVLYNDFLPPGMDIHSEWDYFAFGYYDGISVGENLYTEESNSLELLWNYEKEKLKELKGKYSEKIVFGFRSEGENNGAERETSGDMPVDDEEFWRIAKEKGTEYPFIFVTLLQIKADIEKLGAENRQKLESLLTCRGERLAISYLTLDNSDMILVILCKRYQDGTNILDGFHRKESESPLTKCGLTLTYSFTIAAVQREGLNHHLEAIGRAQQEPVKQAYVYVIEKMPGCIDRIRDKIADALGLEEAEKEKKVKKESILGCNDEVIAIKNITWDSFLRLFQDKSGVLNNSNPDYYKNLIGVTTIIAQAQESDIFPVTADNANASGEDENEQKEEGENESPLLSDALRKLTDKLNYKGLPYTTQYENLSRYLYQIINSLQKFERSMFPDYIFVSTFLPLNLVMLMSGDVNEKTAERFFASFYEFIKGLNLYVQNATHSDRQFTQTVNFDIRIYSTPVKMNAFYNAFIYLLKTYLDTENGAQGKHEYEFLTCLGVADNMGVQELFKNVSEKQRLFLVNIPENQAYNPKQMLIMLSHEVGHFVGNKVRDREGRYKYAISIMAKTIVIYFQVYLKKHVESEEYDFIQCERYWKELDETLERLIREYLDKMEDENYLVEEKFRNCSEEEAADFCRQYKKYKTYTHLLKEGLIDSCTEIIKEHKDELYGYLVEKDYVFWIMKGDENPEKKKQEMDHKLSNAAVSLLQTSVWSNQELSLKTIAEDMMYLFKECVADLIGILTLRLSMDDYLQALVNSVQGQSDRKGAIGEINRMRSALVVFCMASAGAENGTSKSVYTWNFDQVENGRMGGGIKKLKNDISEFIDRHLTTDNAGKEETEEGRLYVFYRTDVLKELEKYFMKCRDTLNEHYAHCAQMPEERMHPVYQLFQGGDVEDMVLDIQKYIAEYHDKVQEKISRYAEDENNEDKR